MRGSLSTASAMDSDTNVTTDHSVPTTAEGDPISWDGNKAHIEGILADIDEWGTRTGQFVALVENRAVVLKNGSLAVESLQTVQFVNGAVPDLRGAPFKHSDPCPTTEQRIRDYDALATATKKSAFTRLATTPGPGSGVVIAPYTIKADDAKYLTSLSHVIKEAPDADTLLQAANGSGTALIALLKAEGAKATGRDKALVSARFARLVNAGVSGELTRSSFKGYYKAYKKERRNLPPAARAGADAVELETINTIAYKDPTVRNMYALKSHVTPPANAADAVAMLLGILEENERSDQIDQLTTGAATQPNISALVAEEIAKQAAALAAGSRGRPIVATVLLARTVGWLG